MRWGGGLSGRSLKFLNRSEAQGDFEILVFPEASSVVQKLRPLDRAGQEVSVRDIGVRGRVKRKLGEETHGG